MLALILILSLFKIESTKAKYHEDFEKSKGNYTVVSDDPETRRAIENSKIISQVRFDNAFFFNTINLTNLNLKKLLFYRSNITRSSRKARLNSRQLPTRPRRSAQSRTRRSSPASSIRTWDARSAPIASPRAVQASAAPLTPLITMW